MHGVINPMLLGILHDASAQFTMWKRQSPLNIIVLCYAGGSKMLISFYGKQCQGVCKSTDVKFQK
jgi:hypothetical protein